MRDFSKELNSIFQKYDTSQIKPIVPPQPKEVKQKPKKEEPKVFYNIRKRSLPVKLDQPVMFRLAYEEAKKWLCKLKPKFIECKEHGDKIVHYYDIVRDDGYKAGVFDNDGEITKAEGSDDQIQIGDDIEWKG